MMDRTIDTSLREQVSIIMLFVTSSGSEVTLEERLLCLVAATEATAEVLTTLP